jgi:hypothetical protein
MVFYLKTHTHTHNAHLEQSEHGQVRVLFKQHSSLAAHQLYIIIMINMITYEVGLLFKEHV